MLKKASFLTRPTQARQDALYPERGPSEAARCASKGLVPATPRTFQHPDYSTR